MRVMRNVLVMPTLYFGLALHSSSFAGAGEIGSAVRVLVNGQENAKYASSTTVTVFALHNLT